MYKLSIFNLQKKGKKILTLLQKNTSGTGGWSCHGRENHGEDENGDKNRGQREFRYGHWQNILKRYNSEVKGYVLLGTYVYVLKLLWIIGDDFEAAWIHIFIMKPWGLNNQSKVIIF